MRNYYLDKVQKGYDFRKVIGNNYNLMLKAKNKRRNQIPRDRTLFDITYKGYKFDCLPYLVNSMASIGRYEYDNVLLDLTGILKKCGGDKFYTQEKLKLKEKFDYKASVLNRTVLYSLHFTQFSFNLIMMCLLILDFDGEQELYKYLYDFYFAMLLETITFGYTNLFYEFSDKNLCNTEVTGYYMGLLWVLSRTPEIRRYGGVNFKKIDIVGKIEKNMPDNSIHAQYVRGEITENELNKRCGFHGGRNIQSIMCPLVEMEHLSIILEGNYDGSEPMNELRDVLDDWAEDLYSNYNFVSTCRNMLGSFGYNTKMCHDLYNDSVKNVLLVTKMQEDKAKAEATTRLAKQELKNKEKELEKSQKKLIEQEIEIKRLKENSSENLKRQLDEANKKIKEFEKLETVLSTKILEQKKMLSTKAKEIKNLTALVPEVEQEELQLKEQESLLTIEDAISICKDKKILIVGGYGLSNMENKLLKYGFDNVNMIIEARTISGNYDIVVVMTKFIKHKMVRLVDKYCTDAKIFIPYNGTNIDTLIIKMAEEINECNS